LSIEDKKGLINSTFMNVSQGLSYTSHFILHVNLANVNRSY
jgi:hypothetical protein